MTQLFGCKYVRLVAPSHSFAMYPHSDPLLWNTSRVDVEMEDPENFPEFAHVPFLECILRPGEMLFIPVRLLFSLYLSGLPVCLSSPFYLYSSSINRTDHPFQYIHLHYPVLNNRSVGGTM